MTDSWDERYIHLHGTDLILNGKQGCRFGLESQPNPRGFHYVDPAWYHLGYASEHVYGGFLQP